MGLTIRQVLRTIDDWYRDDIEIAMRDEINKLKHKLKKKWKEHKS